MRALSARMNSHAFSHFRCIRVHSWCISTAMHSKSVALCCILMHFWHVAFVAVAAFTLHFRRCILSAFDVMHSIAFRYILDRLHSAHAALQCIPTTFCTCCISRCCILGPVCIRVHSWPTAFRDCCIPCAFHHIPRRCILDTHDSQKCIRDLLHCNTFEHILNTLHSICGTDTCIRMHCRMRCILTTCCIRTLSHTYCIRMQTHALCMHYEARFVRLAIMHMNARECKRMHTKCTRSSSTRDACPSCSPRPGTPSCRRAWMQHASECVWALAMHAESCGMHMNATSPECIMWWMQRNASECVWALECSAMHFYEMHRNAREYNRWPECTENVHVLECNVRWMQSECMGM